MKEQKEDLLDSFENPEDKKSNSSVPNTDNKMDTPVSPEMGTVNPNLKDATERGINPGMINNGVPKSDDPMVDALKTAEKTSDLDKPISQKEFKKNMIFIGVLFVVVLLFIIFLPKIMSILS